MTNLPNKLKFATFDQLYRHKKVTYYEVSSLTLYISIKCNIKS